MVEVRMAAGARYDLVSTAELQAHQKHLDDRFNEMVRAELRGIKIMRAPDLIAQAAGTTLVLPATGNNETVQAPEMGYVWRVVNIIVSSTGVDTGNVNLYISSDGTANQSKYHDHFTIGTAYYPSRLFLQPGEQLAYSLVSVATNFYRARVQVFQAPAEMAGKLI